MNLKDHIRNYLQMGRELRSEGIAHLRKRLGYVDTDKEDRRAGTINYINQEVILFGWRHVYANNKDGTLVARIEKNFVGGFPTDDAGQKRVQFLLDSFPQMKVTEYKNRSKNGDTKIRLTLQGKHAEEFCRFRHDMITRLIESGDERPPGFEIDKPLNSIITDLEFYFKWLELPKLPRGRGKRTPEMLENVRLARESFLFELDQFYGRKRAE